MIEARLEAVWIALVILVVAKGNALATETKSTEWVTYAEETNGDRYFYDPLRVHKNGAVRQVWNGIQYKTSLMGAFSFRSLLEIDCSERTEKTLQYTFFSDKHWERAAMKTNMKVSENRSIVAGSTTDRLAKIVCN